MPRRPPWSLHGDTRSLQGASCATSATGRLCSRSGSPPAPCHRPPRTCEGRQPLPPRVCHSPGSGKSRSQGPQCRHRGGSVPGPAVQAHLAGSIAAASLRLRVREAVAYGFVLARTSKGRTSFCLDHLDIQVGGLQCSRLRASPGDGHN